MSLEVLSEGRAQCTGGIVPIATGITSRKPDDSIGKQFAKARGNVGKLLLRRQTILRWQQF